MTPVHKASYALFAFLLAAVIYFDLDAAVLAGLFSYMILDLSNQQLARRLQPREARWLSLLIFLVAATALTWIFARFTQKTLSTLPRIISAATPKFVELSSAFGIPLPFGDADELRDFLTRGVRVHLQEIASTTQLVSLQFFHIVLGIVIAILCFMASASERYLHNLHDALRHELGIRMRIFMVSFERVFGAQMLIAAINTAVTAAFLLVMGFPHALFLVLGTFVLGTIPVIGNLMSNTIILATALTISLQHAVSALVFLVVIHKAEYILNSRIMGSSIDAPMWQTLCAILAGQVVMGVPGMILAPTVLHYAKTEMQLIPWKTS